MPEWKFQRFQLKKKLQFAFPHEEEQLWRLFCLVINTKLMNFGSILRIYVGIYISCRVPSTPGMLILTPAAAGWTLLDIWDMEKCFPDFLDLEIRVGRLNPAQGTTPKEEVWIPYSLPLVVTPGAPRGHFQAQKRSSSLQNPAPNGNAALYTQSRRNFSCQPGFRVEQGKKKSTSETNFQVKMFHRGPKSLSFKGQLGFFPHCKPSEVAEMSCFNFVLEFFFFFFWIAGAQEQNYPNRGAQSFYPPGKFEGKGMRNPLQLRAAACCCKHPTESSFQHLPASSQGCLQRH